jgi:hypothetical protein
MKIQTFRDKTGLIHGSDSKRIGCEIAGTLKIGKAEIAITPEEDSIMPLLINGGTGDYDATFTTKEGEVYNLERVKVREGRILPPSPYEIKIMELQARADTAEEERDALRQQLYELSQIFDTNSLNFLIK